MSVIEALVNAPKNIVNRSLSRKAYLSFAQKYDFVYFGYVNQQTDEHQLVRGITLSAVHVDTNYCIGHFNGHDVTFVQRRDTVSFPGKKDESYTWNIAQVDLKRQDMPHTFIDANHHDEAFYANLFLKFVSLKNLNPYFNDVRLDPKFSKSFKVYGKHEDAGNITNIFDPSTIDVLLQQFRHFDYELLPDRLLVYSDGNVTTLRNLEQLLRASVFLSEHCNSQEL